MFLIDTTFLCPVLEVKIIIDFKYLYFIIILVWYFVFTILASFDRRVGKKGKIVFIKKLVWFLREK